MEKSIKVQKWLSTNFENDSAWSKIESKKDSKHFKKLPIFIQEAFLQAKKRNVTHFYRNGFYVAPSDIEAIRDQDGVYSVIDILPNTLIGIYPGIRYTSLEELLNKADSDKSRYNKTRYTWEFKDFSGNVVYIDPTNKKGQVSLESSDISFIPYLNESPEGRYANIFSTHWRSDEDATEDIQFVSCAKIPKNTELWQHYGENYYRTIEGSSEEYVVGEPCRVYTKGTLKDITNPNYYTSISDDIDSDTEINTGAKLLNIEKTLKKVYTVERGDNSLLVSELWTRNEENMYIIASRRDDIVNYNDFTGIVKTMVSEEEFRGKENINFATLVSFRLRLRRNNSFELETKEKTPGKRTRILSDKIRAFPNYDSIDELVKKIFSEQEIYSLSSS
jgi:hypothetical protein